jgi:hypothetical protein
MTVAIRMSFHGVFTVSVSYTTLSAKGFSIPGYV